MLKFNPIFCMKDLRALPEAGALVYACIGAVALIFGSARHDAFDRILIGMVSFGFIVGVFMALYGTAVFVWLLWHYGQQKGGYASRVMRRLMCRMFCTAWLGVNILAMFALMLRHMK